ncbi:MAG: dihydropteroate synthase [Thermoleophilia bacterium]|nr:dihydropteroate synthase [Thermoleophilia bacterium]
MGILNVTPDSFSDAGRHRAAPAAIRRVGELRAAGAAIIDVGAESTRPGAVPVSEAEEMSRLAPVLAALADGPVGPWSIDTRRASVARAALDAGAVMVNDVTAGADPEMLRLVAERGAAICLMHMRGEPRSMQDDPRYNDVVSEVTLFLAARMDVAVAAGVAEDRIVLDPGIGFGKTLRDNLALLRGLPSIVSLGRPVMVGVSRKGMVGELTGRAVGDRLAGSIGAALAAMEAGAAILRVHDVAETVDAIAAFRAVRGDS